MSTEKTADSRYSEICGATNRHGDPCKLPAGWGTPGSGGDRCKFHGGCSTGPDDTDHLEGNDFAEGNDGGGAPARNSNAEIHGGWSDWWKAYDRFEGETRETVEMLIEEYCETAADHAPEVDADRRERLAKEMATIQILKRRASADAWCKPDGDGDGRGLIITDDDGSQRVNPAHNAAHRLSNRRREIAEKLSLWPGFQ
jgi:hypothetical protein